jgi:hypothetical protein
MIYLGIESVCVGIGVLVLEELFGASTVVILPMMKMALINENKSRV